MDMYQLYVWIGIYEPLLDQGNSCTCMALHFILTLCLLHVASSADNLKVANSLDPDQARQNFGPDPDPNCLTL